MYDIESFNNYYESYADQAYQDYIEKSFYEFLDDMKKACMVPKTYKLPNDLSNIVRFWEVY